MSAAFMCTEMAVPYSLLDFILANLVHKFGASFFYFFSKTHFTSALSSKLRYDLAFPVRLICNNTMSVFLSSVMRSALGNCHQYFVKTTAYDVNLIISLTESLVCDKPMPYLLCHVRNLVCPRSVTAS